MQNMREPWGVDFKDCCFLTLLKAFSFCLQGAEAVARREARVSDVAALKVPAALWVEGRNPPPAGVEKAAAGAGATRALAAAANPNTPPAAAWGVATVQPPPASTATPPPSGRIITACPNRLTCLLTRRASCLTTPWWWWWYPSTRTQPWRPLTLFLTRSRSPQPPCTRPYPHRPPPLQGDLLAPRLPVTWPLYPQSWPRRASRSTWPWETPASSLWMSCSFFCRGDEWPFMWS